MTDGHGHFYERHLWKAVVAIVALVGGVWALSGAPTPWKLVSDIISKDLPASNTLVVFDASAAMARPFGEDGTRLDAALNAVERFTLPVKNEGLALRVFGGSCAEAGDLLVEFGDEHGDEVRDATAEQRPRGRSNLVNAVRAAIDDFADEDFSEQGPRRVVVFAGSVDECSGSTGGEEIADDIEHSGVDTTFKFVGLDLGDKGRKRLLRFKKAIGSPAEVAFVRRESDLDSVEGWLGQSSSRVVECEDGVDNDGDANADDADPQCASSDTEAPQAPAGDCADGEDNDGDGAIDADDPECASGNTEAPQEPTGDCADGEDNDGDGAVDGDDPECASGDSEAPQDPVDECADGEDNDLDGRLDGDDPGCAVDGTEASA